MRTSFINKFAHLPKSTALSVALLLVAIVPVRAQLGSHSVFSSGSWLKVTIANTGVCRINASESGALQGCAIDGLAVYGMEGGQLSMNNRVVPTDDLPELAICVEDANGNGRFDGGDYLLFYAEGASVWRYSDADQFVRYARNTYANNNYYFVTCKTSSGLRIPRQMVVSEGDPAASYTAVGVIDNDEVNTAHSGQIWVGERFSGSVTSRNFVVDMPALVSATQMKYMAALASVSSASASFTVKTSGATATLDLPKGTFYKSTSESCSLNSTGNVEFTITYMPRESGAAGYLDYLQVNADAQLKYAGRMLDMWMIKGSGFRQYPITGCPNDLMVWDVSSPTAPIMMSVSSGAFTDSIAGKRHYVGFTLQQAQSPVEIVAMDNQDLRGAEVPTLVIVSNSSFLEQAERLADIHRVVDGMEVLVATAGQVFNEFSSGRQDPMGIRKMMRHFWKRHNDEPGSAQPRYLLLFGRGTYDNRNINGNNRGCVVTYQTPTSFDDEVYSYASDAVLCYLDDNESGYSNESMEISVGRLPAANVAEATHLVDKIERYIHRADLSEEGSRGDWRNYVALLADDADPSKVGDTAFTSSSEYTAKKIQSRYPHINVDKIYADAYIQQSGAVGSYYPDANNAVKNRMNYGTLILNYVGHGSVQYIGTERYMELTDIEAFHNKDRLAFFIGSTCSYGRYDNPELTSGAEYFILAENAGIGSIAASRPISHDMQFNTALNVNLLDPALSVGDALRVSQNNHHQSQSITLFGDPALHLSLPQKKVVVTSINHRAVESGRADTALVLSEVVVEGEIRNSDGSMAEGFNGSIYPIVYDRVQKAATLGNDNDTAHVAFTQQKAVLYKGRDTVTDGHWSYSFVVPRDVAYEFGAGRLSHYAKDGTMDAAGSYTNILFGGFNQGANLDETRPEIRLFMGDTNFVDGGLVDERPTLLAVLRDEIGINAFGSGLGHDITAVIDGNANGIINLNDFYETDFYDSRKGTVTYSLDRLGSGLHTLTLKAWNIFNYSNEASITFRVKGSDTTSLGRFFAFPNPAVDEAVIHAEFNNAKTIESVRIDLYDMHGQMFRSFEPAVQPGGYVVPVRWDLCTAAGNKVMRGVYLARVTAMTHDGQRLMECLKVVVR